MQINMYAASVEIFLPMLETMRAVLDKGAASAQARQIEAAVLVNARLAPDMLALSRQVQLACDFAKNSTARLAALEAPRYDDVESTFEELRARIDKTVRWVRDVPPGALEGAEDRDIRVPLRDRTLEMKGLPFLQRWALPNFFFHVTTAYDILRHNGVELGKRDFLGGV